MVRRFPLAAAIAFAVLSVLAVVVVPLGPGIEKSGSDVVEHVGAHAGMIRLQALLTALAMLAAVVIVGYARDRLDGPAGHMFTVGAAVLTAQVGVQVWFSAGLALHPALLDPATARVLADISSMWGPLLTVSAIVVAGPVLLGRSARPIPAVDGPHSSGFRRRTIRRIADDHRSCRQFHRPRRPDDLVRRRRAFGRFLRPRAVCGPTQPGVGARST